MWIMMNGPSEGLDGVLNASQLVHKRQSVDGRYDESSAELTSDRSGTWGGADWGKGAGVEEEGWVRTEIIALGLWWGRREGGHRLI